MGKRYKTALSQLYCPKCGNIFPIRRSYGQQRNKGHLKKYYCVYCNEEVNCLEVREKDHTIANVK